MLKRLQKQTLWIAALGLMTLCMPWTVQAEEKKEHGSQPEKETPIPEEVATYAKDYWEKRVLSDDDKVKQSARFLWYATCEGNNVVRPFVEDIASQLGSKYDRENSIPHFCRATKKFKSDDSFKEAYQKESYDDIVTDAKNVYDAEVKKERARADGKKPTSDSTDEEKRKQADQEAQRRFAESEKAKELDRFFKDQQQRALFDQLAKAQQGKQGGSGGSSGSGRGSRGSRGGSGGDNNFKPPAHQRIPRNESKIGEALANALDRKDGKNSLSDFFKNALGNDRDERRRGSSDRDKKKSRNSILDAVESALKPPTPVTANDDTEDEPNTDALNDLANQNAPLFQQEQPFVSQADVAGNPISSANAAANLGGFGGGFPFQGFGGGGGGTVTQGGGGGGASGVGASGFSDQTFALKENILGKYKSDGGGSYVKKENYGTGSGASGGTTTPNAGGVDKSQYSKGKKFRRGGTNGALVIDRTTEADEMIEHSVFGAVRAIYGGDLCQIQLSDGKPPGICETVEGEKNIRVNSITGARDS